MTVLVSCMHASNTQSTWFVVEVLVIPFASSSNVLWVIFESAWCYNSACHCVEPCIKQHLFYQSVFYIY